MFIFSIFSKMRNALRERVALHEPGLYLYVVFPIAISFLLTFIGARVLNHFQPDFYIPWPINAHVHHYAYGFFVLATSGYLALVFAGPRSKFWICLLHGFGLGLAFDEYGLWLRLEDNQPERWGYDGFLIVVGAILIIISAKPGVKFVKNHLHLRRGGQLPLP